MLTSRQKLACIPSSATTVARAAAAPVQPGRSKLLALPPAAAELQQRSRVVGMAGPSRRLQERIPTVGGLAASAGLPSGTSASAPSSDGLYGTS